jgi:hypothetical protein
MLVLFIQGCGGGESSAPFLISTPTKTETSVPINSVVLPLYIYPTEWETNSELTDLMDATNGKFIAIINPDNGPGASQNTDFVDGIDYLYSQGVKVVAYVYTSYGNRSKDEIYDDIDSYISFYGTEKVTGVFFDEISLNNDANQTFVKDISSYAKSKDLDFIILNPGTTISQSIIDENYYDVIVTYENSYDDYKDFHNPLISSQRTKQILWVYDYPDLLSYSDEIVKAKDMHYDYLYFTIDDVPNPWDSVFNFLK